MVTVRRNSSFLQRICRNDGLYLYIFRNIPSHIPPCTPSLPSHPQSGCLVSRKESPPPEKSQSKMFALGSRETLTREIVQKFESVKESERTARKKKAWCESLERNITERYPTSRLFLVGSSATGFATEGCDVDLTLVRPDRAMFYASDSSIQVLRRIRDGLSTMRTIDAQVIYSYQRTVYC